MTSLYMKAKCVLLHMRPHYSKEVTLENTAMQSTEFSVFGSVSLIHRTFKSGQAGDIVVDPVCQQCRDQDISCGLVPQASRNYNINSKQNKNSGDVRRT